MMVALVTEAVATSATTMAASAVAARRWLKIPEFST
jgi:hypothetical protein